MPLPTVAPTLSRLPNPSDKYDSRNEAATRALLVKYAQSVTAALQQISSHASGRAVLVAGAVTVLSSAVTDTSDIRPSIQIPGGTPGSLYISARISGTSFTITSTSALDTSTVAWEFTL